MQRVQIVIEAQADQAQRVINEINRSLGSIGQATVKQAAQSVNTYTDSLKRAVQVSDQLVRTGYRLTIGLSAPLLAIIAYAVRLGSELEAARISFEVLIGSAQRAAVHIKELIAFGLTTPFDFLGLVNLSRFLQASGIEAQRVIPLLKSIGNALAVIGGSDDAIQRVVLQISHIQTLGRVTLRELNPIARAGIPVFEFLADAIRRPGEAADETGRRLRRLIAGGLIPGPEFIKFFEASLNARFVGGLEKVSQTIKTRLANLIEAFELAGAELAEGFAPAIIFILDLFSRILAGVRNLIGIFNALPNSIKLVIGLFVALTAVVGPLVLAFGYLARALTSTFELYNKVVLGKKALITATTDELAASIAATTAKQRETAASLTLANAVSAETAAKEANAAATAATAATQLGLFDSIPVTNPNLPGYQADYSKASADVAKLRREILLAETTLSQVRGNAALIAKQRLDALHESLRLAESRAAAAYANIASVTTAIPQQLSLGFSTASSDVEKFDTAIKQVGVSTVATSSRITQFLTRFGRIGAISLAIAAAVNELIKIFKKMEGLGPILQEFSNDLAAIGISFKTVQGIVGGTIDFVKTKLRELIPVSDEVLNRVSLAIKLAFNPFGAIGDVVEIFRHSIVLLDNEIKKAAASGIDLTKNLPDFIKDYLTELDKKREKEAADANAKKEEEAQALRDALAKNQAVQEYNKLLEYSLEANKRAREYAIEAEGKELGGLQQINTEFTKLLDQLTTKDIKIPGTDRVQEYKVALPSAAQLDLIKGTAANIANALVKVQDDLVKQLGDLEDEYYKTRLDRINDYAAARVSRIESLARLEVLSAAEAAKQSAAIDKEALDRREEIQKELIRLEKERSLIPIQRGIRNLDVEDYTANVQRTAALLFPESIEKQKNLIDALFAYRETALKQFDAQRQIIEYKAEEKSLAIHNEIALKKYEIDKALIEEENRLTIDLLNKRRDLAYNAAADSISAVSRALDAQEQAALQSLEASQASSTKQLIEIEETRFNIKATFLEKQVEAELAAQKLRVAEALRLEEQELRKRTDDEQQIQAILTQIQKNGDIERLQIAADGYAKLAALQQNAALEQIKIVKDSTLSIYQSINSSTNSMLDQILSKSKSVFGAIKDTVKGAFLSVFKQIANAQISSGLTKLLTGQKVEFQTSGLGGGALGPLGDFLSRLGLGNAVVRNPSSLDLSVTQANYELAIVTSEKLIEEYAALRETVAILKDLPEPPAQEVATAQLISDELAEAIAASNTDIIKALSLSSIQNFVNSIDVKNGAIPVIITSLEAEAAKSLGGLNLREALEPADEESLELLQQIQAIANRETEDKTAILNFRKEFEKSTNFFKALGVDTSKLVFFEDALKGQKVTFDSVVEALKKIGADTSGIPKFEDAIKQQEKVLKETLPTLKTDKEFSGFADYNASKIASDELARAKYLFKELIGAADGVSPVTKTPVYLQPLKDPTEIGAYSYSSDIIRLHKDNAFGALLHEDTHAAFAKSNVAEDYVAKLIPPDIYSTANQAMLELYDSYEDVADRQADILARLFAGEGYTLGLSREQSDIAVQAILQELKNIKQDRFLPTNEPFDITLSKIYELGRQRKFLEPYKLPTPYSSAESEFINTLPLPTDVRQDKAPVVNNTQINTPVQVINSVNSSVEDSLTKAGKVAFSSISRGKLPSFSSLGSTAAGSFLDSFDLGALLGPGGTAGFSGPYRLGGNSTNSIYGSIFGSSARTASTLAPAISSMSVEPVSLIPGMGSVGVTASGQVVPLIGTAANGAPLGLAQSASTGFSVASLFGNPLGILRKLGNLGAGTGHLARGITGIKGGALLLGGGILAADGLRRGGIAGLLETTAGGALIGAKFGGPIGALIGGAIGLGAGLVRLFTKTGPEKVKEKVKKLYSLNIDTSFAKQVFDVIKQNFAGNIDVGLRSQQVLELLDLYAQATGQPFGFANKPRNSTLVGTESGIYQQAIYEGNRALSFSGIPVLGGVATTLINTPQRNGIGGLLPYQFPSANMPSPASTQSAQSLAAPTIIVENSLPENAVGSYMDGRVVRTVAKSGPTVTKAVTSSYKSNIGRNENTRLQTRPNEILT